MALFVVLFLFGCTSTEDSSTSNRFIGGTTGLTLSFVDGEPPSVVGDNAEDEFDVSILAINDGEADIDSGRLIVTLQGVERDAFSMSSLSQSSPTKLEKKTKIRDTVTESDQLEIRFKRMNYKYNLDSDFPVDLRADVCYEYNTKAVADICLKKKPNDDTTEDLCTVNNENMGLENSGAPVHVVSMSQIPRSSSIKLTFDIMTQGTGMVYAPGVFGSECVETPDMDEQVRVKVSTTGNIPIKCSRLNDGSEGIVDLISGGRTVSCDIETSGLQETAFSKPINIELSYMYKDSIATSFTVENTDFN